MALIDCPECGWEVSERAPMCPHCGVPIYRSTSQVAEEPADAPTVSTETVTHEPKLEQPDAEPSAPDSQLGETVPPSATSDAESEAQPAYQGGHIFVSYKSEDRHRARTVAEALERRGWPVWWDRDIQAGQAFRRVIARALNDAVCVVVLWTELAIESDWVQEEAQEAKARGILIPALLDEVRPPLGFGQMQSASLVGWNGDPNDPMLDGLLRGVTTLLGLAEVPPLLGEEDWGLIVKSGRMMRGQAAAAQATDERAAAAASREEADRAASERAVAAEAGEAEAEEEAARREVNATVAADRATVAAEEREAEMAAELAAEHAVELRAVAARRAEKATEAQAAEEAALRAEDERKAALVTGEREAKARAAEREASLRVAEEAAKAAEDTADQVAAARAAPERWAASGIGATEPAAKASWFRFPREGLATLLGAILVGVSAFLPWADGRTALEFSLSDLRDVDFDLDIGGDLGLLLLAVAIIGGVLALFRVPRWITVILGVVAVAVALWFLVDVIRLLSEDNSAERFFEIVNIGPVVTIVGGFLMLSGR